MGHGPEQTPLTLDVDLDKGEASRSFLSLTLTLQGGHFSSISIHFSRNDAWIWMKNQDSIYDWVQYDLVDLNMFYLTLE